ncbi:hypothetical protein LAC81_04835 [Ensifer adhaerens]|uniref:hypothetical protein n=1 Tax=Ensifer adhaerens TaxID=106592 RepID=UPI001CBEA1DD|nr:hypothetical protein [Ensifer adhaerens]MBZ7921116.1 hypothetical protein [Ensifer adhaerens]UAX93558.1 hypothetical protein LAC78_04830 [Ensifer adhaerens]UAY01194.1 hypothetical protein LAC80_04835 [Ensifer adhaerens]UAY08576.1 hypothetical protein LAC81_04835 [Ensifer adhaerens]
MPLKSLLAITALVVLTLSGCATSGSTNTTYAQWTGPYPEPDVSASSPGGFRMSY